MKIGNREFQVPGTTYVMGILNVTPDSFSDGGKFNNLDSALSHVEKMISEGAALIDVGGESTRPGAEKITAEEEIDRVVPVIEKIKAEFDVPISLDTYHSKTAKAGIEAGVSMINDIWGLQHDPEMIKVIVESGVVCCLTHNRSETTGSNFINSVFMDLTKCISMAEKSGIVDNRIILDPGIGFGKTYEQNLEIIRRMGELGTLGCPLLLGCSRKSVIGLTLDLPADQRLEGTLVTTVAGVLQGAMFVRVHDVRENVRAVRMAEAIFAERVSGG